jgi:hypothetical protein
MAPVFRSLGGVETCGGGDFAIATGYYRPGGGEAGWNFILGRFRRGSSSCGSFPNRGICIGNGEAHDVDSLRL